MSGPIMPNASDVLIVVDAQNDFCSGGALPIPRADEIMFPTSQLARRFAHVVLTQDWHPAGHNSFASAHPGRRPYETMKMPYGSQILWPDHCLQESHGAAFHRNLAISHATAIIRKGTNPRIDSYSTFYENDRATPTGLTGYLRERGLTRVFLAGLALDFCVRYSAEDAGVHGFSVVIVEDCCRAIDIRNSLDDAVESVRSLGVSIVSSDDIL